MGKFVKPLDIESEIAKVMTSVRKYLKTVTCNVGNIECDRLLENKVCVVIDNDGKLGSDVALALNKMKNVSTRDVVECEGTYDWIADTYIRPCSAILVVFQ